MSDIPSLLLTAKKSVPDSRKVLACYREIAERLANGEKYPDMPGLNHAMKLVSNIPDTSRKGKIAILCYKSPAIGKWCPDSPGGAGSEEAVIYCAKLLAKDYNVVVYADPESHSPHCAPLMNPRYTAEECPRTGIYDDVICWRHLPSDAKKIVRVDGKVHLWLHDMHSRVIEEVPDTVFYLTDYHHKQYLRRQLNWHGATRSVVAGNGVDDPPSKAGAPRKMMTLVYASNYARGLIHLLHMWPELKSIYPKLSLHIAYGRVNWGNLTDEELATIVNLIENLPDVKEYGKLGYTALTNLMRQCSIWAYPFSGSCETFCITAVRAQRCGLIPVTTREAALIETVSPDAPTIDHFEYSEYKKLLVDTIAKEHLIDRQLFIDYSMSYTWQSTISKWEEEFARGISTNLDTDDLDTEDSKVSTKVVTQKRKAIRRK